MGTTAEKLTYLNTTKQNLKTVINTTGAGLTDESAFRSYANVLNDKILGTINGDVDLFEEYPKVSGNGTDLSLNGVVEGKMSITPQGVSKQESTTGKNLFHILGLDATTVPKVTSSSSVLNRVNNNEIVMTAVGTWSNVSIDFGENFFNTNQNIIASADFLETISGRTSKVGLQFYGSTNGETYTSIQTTGIIDINYNIKQHLSVIANTGEYTYIRLRIWNNVSSASVSRGDSVINVSNIMVVLGTDDTYEPYTGGIPAPNPSYPYPVKSVTGENSLVLQNANLFDKNSSNWFQTYIGQTTHAISTNTSNTNFKTIYIKCLPNTNYYIKKFVGAGSLVMGTTELEPTLGMTLNDYILANATNSAILTGENANYLVVQISSNTDINNGYTVEEITNNVSITKGSTAPTTYVEHEEQNYQLSLGNIELNSTLDGTIRDGIIGKPNEWYKREYIGKVVLDGSETWSINTTQDGNYRYHKENFIDAKNDIGYCTHFKIGNIADRNASGQINKFFVGSITPAPQTLQFVSDITTVANFKAFLQTQYNNNNPVTVYYEHIENVDNPITDTTLINQLNDIYNNAHSYNGVTNITTTYASGNEQMYLDIEALKNVWDTSL